MKSIYKMTLQQLSGCRKKNGSVLLLLLLTFAGCKKYVELDAPETKISSVSAFTNNNTATAVLTGLYAQLSNNYLNSISLPAISIYDELSADNLVLYDVSATTTLASFYQNSLEPQYLTNYNQHYWSNTYSLLFTINTAIAALTNNAALSPAVRNRLLGEACFLRSFCYFYLVNEYGEVPLILTTDYTQNRKSGRASVATVYEQIMADLNQAEALLDNNYAALDVTKTTNERVRPNLAAVNALQARVYLYQKDYAAAEAAATKVIVQSGQYTFTPLNMVFIKNSKETIWALQPVNNGYSTREAQFYILPPEGPDNDRPAYLSASLLNSFEEGDDRKRSWIEKVVVDADTYCYPAKYKVPYIDGATVPAEYTIVLRLGEQYLVRAEARNEQGNTVGAIEDLNALRKRSRAAATVAVPNPLQDLSASLTMPELKKIILKERRVELFTEWGHRWFDLKRSETIDSVMTAAEIYKGGTWENYKNLNPVPVADILLNPAISQNPGYSD